jgi:cytochrome c peroxidase
MSAARFVVAAALISGCAAELEPSEWEFVAALPPKPPEPVDNPTLPTTVELGRLLFWDPILSGNRDVACATCHHPDFAYGDGLDVSVGIGGRGIGPRRAESIAARRTPRNSQTVLGTGWNGITTMTLPSAETAPMFWDNRKSSLEVQALEPIKSEVEMRGTSYSETTIINEVVGRLTANSEYQNRFAAAFGTDVDGGVSAANLAKALAAFQRTLVPLNSSFDRFMAGDDTAMSTAQIRGLRGFLAKGCARCHSGPMFSDYEVHQLPVGTRDGDTVDKGDGSNRFRTPSLRMVTKTAPYFHNGTAASLEDVLGFYDNNDLALTDPLLEGIEPPIGGGDGDLLLFFEALSDGEFDRQVPASVPSGLPPGGQ